ncbi:hypothetical protein VA7868_01585 [Vibrio aerogenes CECT 7868]|uniref:Uncharacterized protein n=1 Tax=Vibrio aerogenes CECT 7868 TaxID=1216006 RepID=A0A1M5YBD2_9VIBR|nr:hypothetical protein VA7868_01585 [Vibrio aerogenes CECT 7868]
MFLFFFTTFEWMLLSFCVAEIKKKLHISVCEYTYRKDLLPGLEFK